MPRRFITTEKAFPWFKSYSEQAPLIPHLLHINVIKDTMTSGLHAGRLGWLRPGLESVSWPNRNNGICVSAPLGALTQMAVHPALPVLLTKNGPLVGGLIDCLGSIKQPRRLVYSILGELVKDISSSVPSNHSIT